MKSNVVLDLIDLLYKLKHSSKYLQKESVLQKRVSHAGLE